MGALQEGGWCKAMLWMGVPWMAQIFSAVGIPRKGLSAEEGRTLLVEGRLELGLVVAGILLCTEEVCCRWVPQR